MSKATKHRHLLLIGGGHSHLFVLEHLARHPVAGVDVTLVSRELLAPYSGMIPGLIAGHYSFEDAHINLSKLCARAGVQCAHDEVIALDTDQQTAHCRSGKNIHYDVLSINIGSAPDLATITHHNDTGIVVKPIPHLLDRWRQLAESLAHAQRQRHITVVGGGAASIEVALAMHYQLQQQPDNIARRIQWTLITGSPQILPTYPRRVQRLARDVLEDRRFTLLAGHTVSGVNAAADGFVLELEGAASRRADAVIWAIQAGAQDWLRDSGLACTGQGFVRVNPQLQSVSHANIFAAGDIAHFEARPLPKSGVFAVREGIPLAHNLVRALNQQPLQPFKPQKHCLNLLSLGDQRAIASWGPLSASGRWVWRWKNHIDRRFMRRFQL